MTANVASRPGDIAALAQTTGLPCSGYGKTTRPKLALCSGRRAHNSPAGEEAAKSGANPALSPNCDAPPPGTSQVDRFAPNGRQPSEEGRFVRQPPPGLFLRKRGGFS